MNLYFRTRLQTFNFLVQIPTLLHHYPGVKSWDLHYKMFRFTLTTPRNYRMSHSIYIGNRTLDIVIPETGLLSICLWYGLYTHWPKYKSDMLHHTSLFGKNWRISFVVFVVCVLMSPIYMCYYYRKPVRANMVCSFSYWCFGNWEL